MKIWQEIIPGQGYNTINHRPARLAMKGNAEPTPKSDFVYEIRIVESHSQLNKALSVVTGISLDFAPLQSPLSLDLNASSENGTGADAINLLIVIKHIRNVKKLSPEHEPVDEILKYDYPEPPSEKNETNRIEIFSKYKIFLDKFGDVYATEIQEGSALFALIRISLTNLNESKNINTQLNATLGQLGSGKAGVHYVVNHLDEFSLTNISIRCVGVDNVPSGQIEPSQFKKIINTIEESLKNSKTFEQLNVEFTPFTTGLPTHINYFAQKFHSVVDDTKCLLKQAAKIYDDCQVGVQKFFTFDALNTKKNKINLEDKRHLVLQEKQDALESIMERINILFDQIANDEIYDDDSYVILQQKINAEELALNTLKKELPELSRFTLIAKIPLALKDSSNGHFRLTDDINLVDRLPPNADHLFFEPSTTTYESNENMVDIKLDLKEKSFFHNTIQPNIVNGTDKTFSILPLNQKNALQLKKAYFAIPKENIPPLAGGRFSFFVNIYAGSSAVMNRDKIKGSNLQTPYDQQGISNPTSGDMNGLPFVPYIPLDTHRSIISQMFAAKKYGPSPFSRLPTRAPTPIPIIMDPRAFNFMDKKMVDEIVQTELPGTSSGTQTEEQETPEETPTTSPLGSRSTSPTIEKV